MPVIDFHTHIFPDALAERALPKLTVKGVSPVLNGKVSALLASMDAAGIETSVIANIATKPDQFDSIFAWSKAIASKRILPFASVHPDDPELEAHVEVASKVGFKGIKLHPYFQKFALDEPRLKPLYDVVEKSGLVLLVHCGFDVAFPRDRICDPARVRAVADKWPKLKIVAAHLGGWMDWDEAERWLIGRPVVLDLAACFGYLDETRLRSLILRHPAEYLVFGSDSPWFDEKKSVENVRRLRLPAKLEEGILYNNAARLLGLK
jgi:predicted TIM-barrel fold metal-dependent hydrolase